MIRAWLGMLALAALAACASGGPAGAPGSPPAYAGEWRGRWLGSAGHAVAGLSIKPDGAYRITMYLDGGDHVVTGALLPIAYGQARYSSSDGTGRISSDGGRLRFIPDAGGGGGLFDRIK